MTQLSLIIPTYNRIGMLKEAVLSALGQSCPIHEVIIADDGSTEDIATAISDVLRQPHKTRIVYSHSTENFGAPVARNRGIRQSTGDLLMFMDSDDVLAPDGLGRLIAALAADNGLDYVYGQVVVTGPDLERLPGRRLIGSAYKPVPVEYAGNHWHTMAAVYRRAYLDRVGFWNEELTGSQDWEYQARVKIAGGRCLFLQHVVGYWRQHAGPRIGTAIFRPEYTRSTFQAALSIAQHAAEIGRLDGLLRSRLAKQIYLQALEFRAYGHHDEGCRMMREGLRMASTSPMLATVMRLSIFFPNQLYKPFYQAMRCALRWRSKARL